VTSTGAQTIKGAITRTAHFVRAELGMVMLAVLVLVSAGTAAGLIFGQYLPDRRTDDAAAHAAIAAASDGTVALLSYAPGTLDHDFTSAKSHLTGDFLAYYTQFTQQIVAPAAKDKAIKASAAVVRAAVSELHPDSATVLVFINQTTTSSEKPDPAMTASSVRVTLTKVEGAWRISSFDPV
jgi:Mce-associated membrane protein